MNYCAGRQVSEAMRTLLVFIALVLSGCTSVRTYENIVESSIANYQLDNITYQINSWVPCDAPDEFNLTDEDDKRVKFDLKLCLDEYRGEEFNDEATSILYFMKCMNKKGWRLTTEKVIVIEE